MRDVKLLESFKKRIEKELKEKNVFKHLRKEVDINGNCRIPISYTDVRNLQIIRSELATDGMFDMNAFVRHGENIYLHDGKGFYASDIRGDRSRLLPQEGRLLRGGDATGDNEVDEDDVNAVDAAWGTNKSVYNFSRSDMNNDGRVGVEDLSLATSNISNSIGFGARRRIFIEDDAYYDSDGIHLSGSIKVSGSLNANI